MDRGDKEVHICSRGICSKMNLIMRLVFELAYGNATVQHISHYTVDTGVNLTTDIWQGVCLLEMTKN